MRTRPKPPGQINAPPLLDTPATRQPERELAANRVAAAKNNRSVVFLHVLCVLLCMLASFVFRLCDAALASKVLRR